MVVKTVKNPFDIINCRSDERDRFQKTADGFSVESVLHALDTLQSSLGSLKYSTSGRVELETCLLRLCSPELDTSNTALLRRIKILEDKIASANFVSASQPEKPQAQAKKRTDTERDKPADSAVQKTSRSAAPANKPDIPKKQGLPSADSSADVPLECWAEVLEELRKSDGPLFGVLKDSAAVIRGGFVMVEPHNTLFAGLIRSQEHQKPLVEAIRKVTGTPYKVGIFKKDLKKPKAQKDAQSDGMDELFDSAAKAGIKIHEQ